MREAAWMLTVASSLEGVVGAADHLSRFKYCLDSHLVEVQIYFGRISFWICLFFNRVIVFLPFCVPQTPRASTQTGINRPVICYALMLMLLLHHRPGLQQQGSVSPSRTLCSHLPYPGTLFSADSFLILLWIPKCLRDECSICILLK